ncbi:putative protein tyrosine phosphatase (Pyp1) [Aspergillus clavatus NRRL 1]|uniref:protein-tyrosine-phosphatase n=1 Tax=Aspergillus clavatus (strain ATCC 1007 / CBS 513.65 / DSM 816 / NCTC 3887 / NRRL 1 / QM 1276 / 107) TaxID=344612 RepID=A1C8Z4_ASPCL|nr:protein tyrosine phosphatase (Pyp1), putative [Aspergillus clavatus NRRL 1]EAW13318.1 protein tyrosine phosphatase (Pyp1), putative [Aspergillus clavatus NRRL 1]
MSAMTGQRRSPPSPWPQESQGPLQVPGPSDAAPLFSLCDHNPSPLKSSSGSYPASQDHSSPSYFTIKIEGSHDRPDLQHGFGSKSHRASIHPNQSSLPNKKIMSPDRAVPEGFMTMPSIRPGNDHRPHMSSLKLHPESKRKDPLAAHANMSSNNLTPGSMMAISVDHCAELLQTCEHEVLLLDVRPYAHYARANIKGSLNLCIPTTLLKRPSFGIQKLANTFTSDVDKKSFSRWRQCRYIIIYDAATYDMKDAGPITNVLKKFATEGWTGEGFVLRGGFMAFNDRFPALVQQHQSPTSGSPSKQLNSMQTSLPSAAPIAGGCAMPESSSAAIPFFGNIRQNMDLVGGVGQIPLQIPSGLTESKRQLLPRWLRDASENDDRGQRVSEKFLELEKNELERMKQALSYEMAGNPTSAETPTKKYRVAGIEKGTKNRYNDIYPFDHSRVRLQNVPAGDCDYVNANFMKAEYSNKCYIATQAPVPDTFDDFWRVIWEQDVRLVVSLTAEIERGQVKCHRYWESGQYGPLRVNNFSEKTINMKSSESRQIKPQSNKPSSDVSEDAGDPCIIVRHFGLSHSSFPFQPLREVTQLQYPYWPDFGTTSQPSHLLQLIDECNAVTRATSSTGFDSREAEPEGQRPVLVHCSAGCGRTGTFCTVDSVLDMLKRQRTERTIQSRGDKEGFNSDNLDLIAKTVADFRTQRPSMIQNLSQFVLCYESVLEWIVGHMDEGSKESH